MANELSLVINNPNEGEFLKRIVWNKEEFMEFVDSITEKYSGLTYTEDQMKDAKKDRAELNAMKKAISDRRIQVKKAYMVPIDNFEKEVKEVVSIIDDRVSGIDKQVKEFEEKQRQEKRQELEAYYDEEGKDVKPFVPFERIFDSRWMNASVSIKKAKEDIDLKVKSISSNIRSIESMCEEKYHRELKSYYFRTLNIADTFEECRRLRDIDRKLEEERIRREEERLRQPQEKAVTETVETVTGIPENVSKVVENVSNAAENVANAVESVAKAVESVVDPFTPKEEKMFKASFTVYGTKEQIMTLKQYMIDNNIRFGKVER